MLSNTNEPVYMLFYMIVMSLALWTGIRVIRKGIHSPFHWLAVGAIWSIALFQSARPLLYISPIHGDIYTYAKATALFALPLWFHLTFLLLPEPISVVRFRLNTLVIPLAYGVTFMFAVNDAADDRSKLFLWLALWIACMGALSVSNLLPLYWDSREDRSHALMLILGTGLIHIGGVFQIILSYFRSVPWIYVPYATGDIFQIIGLILLGIGIPSELFSRKHSQRIDIPSSIWELPVTAFVYALVALVFQLINPLSPLFLAFFLIVMGSIWATNKILERRKDGDRENSRTEEVVTDIPSQEKKKLTTHQKTILLLIMEGMTNSEIADKLVLAESTVKQHRKDIYRKLNVHSKDEAIRAGEALGLGTNSNSQETPGKSGE